MAILSGASIQIVDLTEKPAREVVVIDVRAGLEDFKFSPDGKQIAVALANEHGGCS